MVNANTELRKLRPAELYNLGLILDPSDNWKRLMASVTKDGENDVPKFPGEYISIVEQAARQERKLAAAIFLEEWATMGRKRPTVGLLLDLLMKNQLFRAADYVAQDIMKVPAPQRPTSGPAAAVDVDAMADQLLRQRLESDSASHNTDFRQRLESDSASHNTDFRQRSTGEIPLSQIEYPMSVFDASAAATNDENRNYDVGVIEMRYAESRSNNVLEAAKIRENDESAKFSAAPNLYSDLMKFTKENPATQSDLLKFETEENPDEAAAAPYEAVMPNLSILGASSTSKNFVEANANFAPAMNAEMTSAELPACLGGFGESSASIEVVEPDNLYFNRELMSAELPLCINDRLATNSTKISAESTESVESEEDDSEDSDSAPEIPRVVVEAQRGKNEGRERNEEKNALASMELPITVLEFHKR